MSNKIRIVKRYRSWHPKAGIEEADVVEIEGGAAGAAQFVSRINANERHDFEIIDYEVALITQLEGPEILTNPTGGGKGRVVRKN